MIMGWFRTLPPDLTAKHGSAQDTGMQGTGPPGQINPGKIYHVLTFLLEGNARECTLDTAFIYSF